MDIKKTFKDFVNEANLNEGKFDGIADLVKALHFETDSKTAEEMKMAIGKSQGEFNKKKQIEGGEYSLRRFRKEIKFGDGTYLGVFLPGSYDAATSVLGDGPHKKAVKKVKWNQKKYDQWLEDSASNGGADNAFDMAQNAKNEIGLIDWVKKEFRGDDPLQRIQWDIEGFAESIVTEASDRNLIKQLTDTFGKFKLTGKHEIMMDSVYGGGSKVAVLRKKKEYREGCIVDTLYIDGGSNYEGYIELKDARSARPIPGKNKFDSDQIDDAMEAAVEYIDGIKESVTTEGKYYGMIAGDAASDIAKELSFYVKKIIKQSNGKVTYFHVKDQPSVNKTMYSLRDLYGIESQSGDRKFSPYKTVKFDNDQIISETVTENRELMKIDSYLNTKDESVLINFCDDAYGNSDDRKTKKEWNDARNDLSYNELVDYAVAHAENFGMDLQDIEDAIEVYESVVTEKITRGLKPLLTIGSTITKKAGEDALLDLSDKFDRIDDEYAGTIASWLDMAIELMQDGYGGDATKKLKQFNKKCKDVLNGKEVGSAFESVVTEKVKYSSSNTKEDAAKQATKEFGNLLPKANKGVEPYVFAVVKTKARNYRLAIKSGSYVAHEFMSGLKGEGILTTTDVKKAVANVIKLNPEEFNESVVNEASEDRIIKQIERALKDGTSIFKLPMATQNYYNKNKGDFEVVTEAKNTIGLAFKEEQDYLDFKEFVAEQPRGAIRKNIGFDSKTKSWNVEMDVKILDSIYGEGTPSDKKSGWYGGLPDDFESVIIEGAISKSRFETFLNEASRRKVHKAAKQGSYPAVIVVVQDGKVIHQEPVSTPDIAPATFNVMQEKYPKALLHLEDKTGKRLFSESIVNEARQAPAKTLFKMIVKGSASEIEGVKISSAMAQAALDWFDRSTYARKYEKQVKTAGMGAVAPLIFGDNWGIKKTIPSKLKAEFKELQAKYKRVMPENESAITEAKFDKKKLMKAMKQDDGMIQLGNGQEYVIYAYDNGNDDNDAMWGDKSIFALDQDGEEHEVKYSDIVSYNESVVTEGMSKSAVKKAIKVIDKQIDTETGGDGEALNNETLQALEQERERLLSMNEAKAYKLKASEFGGDTHSAAYNVKGETTWRVHSTYAIDQVSGENNPEERDVIFFEAMPINNDIYIKIGGINNLKRSNGSTVGENFGTTIEEWKKDPKGIAKEASEFLTDAAHLKWINKKARSEGQVIKWALKDDYASVIEDLVNKSLGLNEAKTSKEKLEYLLWDLENSNKLSNPSDPKKKAALIKKLKKQLDTVKESLVVESSEEAYSLHRLGDNLGQEVAAEFLSKHDVDLKLLTKAVQQKTINKYEIRDVVNGSAHKLKVKTFIKDFVNESSITEGSEIKTAKEIFDELIDVNGEEIANMDSQEAMTILSRRGIRGGKANKIAKELLKMTGSIGESVVTEASLSGIEFGNDDDIHPTKFKPLTISLKKNKVKMEVEKEEGDHGYPEVKLTGKRKDIEKVLADIWGPDSIDDHEDAFESVVSEGKMPDKLTNDDDIVFLKASENSKGAHYNVYYKGYDIDFGGVRFGTEEQLKSYAKEYILSRQWANKLRWEDAKPLPESVVTESKDEVDAKQLTNLQKDIAKINKNIKVYISNHPVTKGKLQIELGADHDNDNEIDQINSLLKKHTGDHKTGTMFNEDVIVEGKTSASYKDPKTGKGYSLDYYSSKKRWELDVMKKNASIYSNAITTIKRDTLAEIQEWLDGYKIDSSWTKGLSESVVNEAKGVNRAELTDYLEKHLKLVRTSEEFDGTEGGVWTSAENGEKFSGSQIFDYYSESSKYEFGVLNKFAKVLSKMGWYCEFYDPGTVMIWEE